MTLKFLIKWPCLFLLSISFSLNAEAAVCDANFLKEKTALTVDTYIDSLAWSRDSRALAAVDRMEHQLYVWDMPSGKLRYKRQVLSQTLKGLIFSGDGKEIYATDAWAKAGTSSAFSIFDAMDGTHIRDVLGPENILNSAGQPMGNNNAKLLLLSSDATLLAAIHVGKSFYSIYDTGSWEIVATVQYNALIPYSAGIEPNDNAIWLIGASGFWDQLRRHRFPKGEFLFGKRFTKNNTGGTKAAALSSDGKLMAIALYAGFQDGADKYSLELWNTGNWEDKLVIEGPNIDQLTFHPTGDLIAGIGMYKQQSTIQIFSAQQRKRLAGWTASAPSQAIAFSPDGSQLAYGDGRRIRICSIEY